VKRIAGLLIALTLATAGTALAQRGMGMPMPDHWLSADSLAKAVGVTDAAVVAKVAPHLAEVDKVLAAVAAERRKMMEAMQAGGGRPDQAAMQAMRTQAEENQKAVDQHLAAVRDALPEPNRAAFDALAKPNVRPRGRMGGGPQ
jgi:hypothetical protein